jgi:cytochrome c oxidase accessory protein FixG
MREQVCKYMCPYARFQSAMFDNDSLIISYDTKRGEPRGSRSRKNAKNDANRGELGDCIDCTLCVQACPTGIDIREGLQYECIACAACIDACDTVMDKMGYPRGLVSYTTENALEDKPTRILRPRTAIYGTVLLVLVVGLTGALSSRHELRMDVLRDRNALYRELATGKIENVYTLKVVNKSDRDHAVSLEVAGLNQLTLETVPNNPVVAAGEMTVIPVRVQADPNNNPQGGQQIEFVLRSTTDPEVDANSTSRFFLPGQ